MARTKAFDPDKVLNKALDIFWTQGYEATSLQDLVHGMGLSRSSLYDTFGDKHTLFLAALEHYRQQEFNKMQQLFAEAPSIKERIQQLFEGIVQNAVADTQRRGCFMANSIVEMAPHDPKVRAMAYDNAVAVRRLLSQAIHQGQERGEISVTFAPTTLAHYLFSAIQGIWVMAKTNPDLTLLQNSVIVTLSVLD